MKNMTIQEIIAECKSHYCCGDCEIKPLCHTYFNQLKKPHEWQVETGCDYCKSKFDAKNLLKTKHDIVFIDPDKNTIEWEHTEVWLDTDGEPEDSTVDVSVEINFCPMCGARLGN